MVETTYYSFPNDLHITWSLMIVMYPYITGLVAGAFIVSSLYHVFNRKELFPVARFSLGASFAFLAVCTFPLLNHLGHPFRGILIFITPNFSSAMAGFGLLYVFYFVVLLLEIWLVNRADIIRYARQSRGIKRLMYKILALGVYDDSPEALEFDHKTTKVLAGIGIPAACLLHGYVGFLFGALKSNPWWSTPLMPIIFLFSAVVSGIAMIIILYQIIMSYKGIAIDSECIQSMCRWLWLFMIFTVTLEMLEIITLAYERAEEWEVISHLLTTFLSFSFLGVQVVFGSLIPFILLAIVVLMSPYLTDRLRNTLAFVSSGILLIQVWSMRWNVVIGGQIISKSFRGFRDFQPKFLEKEGILAAIIIFALPFIIMWIYERILPSFEGLKGKEELRGPELIAQYKEV
jgi:Ni/Fe-hydrogenase subunit HybB-like protein